MTTEVQLTLANPEDFVTVPSGAPHYVPALKTKAGELRALREASADTWRHMTPLIEILGPTHPGADPFTDTRVRGWVKRVADSVQRRPIFLDIRRLAPNHAVAAGSGSQPVLGYMYGQARKRKMQIVPVARLGDKPATLQQIADAMACDGRGVALRIPILNSATADGRPLPTLVSELLDQLGATRAGTDLLFDCGYMSADLEVDAADVCEELKDLSEEGRWRSIVLLGTAIPTSLGGGVVQAGTVGRIPRREWDLFQAVLDQQPVQPVTFGDYAIQHPEPPLEMEDGKVPHGIRAAIRYTHETETIVPRAKAPRDQEGKEQYRALCKLLLVQREYCGPNYTWGDREIDRCAQDLGDAGWEEHWRGAGTSHHLRFVVDQLANVRAA